ncbi:MAG: amidohydrolase family protein [Spirochaetales bacterium]|nr:amidohydrolase family protein [Spirochaetales bacterium]
MIIDFHTHAFPDNLAEKAMAALQSECDVKAFLDGTIANLMESMDAARIDLAVLCSIATKPSQFQPILDWSRTINRDRIIPLPSIHPEDSAIEDHLKTVSVEGFKGIKLHPYYQKFIIDEERVFPIYEACSKFGLLIVCHTGFDIAFPRDRIADPVRILNVAKRFPNLKFISTHYGSWCDWDEVEKHLIGKPVYMENSFSLDLLSNEQALRMYANHPADYLLFGTDSPWTDQKKALELLYGLGLSQELMEKILYRNAARLLGLNDN